MSKFSLSQTTLEGVSDEHIAAIVRKIARHSETQPSSPLHIGEPIRSMSAFFAPAIEQHLEGEVRMVIIHSRLQTITQVVQTDFLLFYHKITTSCLLLASYLTLTCPLFSSDFTSCQMIVFGRLSPARILRATSEAMREKFSLAASSAAEGAFERGLEGEVAIIFPDLSVRYIIPPSLPERDVIPSDLFSSILAIDYIK